jgi:hypothetical protein
MLLHQRVVQRGLKSSILLHALAYRRIVQQQRDEERQRRGGIRRVSTRRMPGVRIVRLGLGRRVSGVRRRRCRCGRVPGMLRRCRCGRVSGMLRRCRCGRVSGMLRRRRCRRMSGMLRRRRYRRVSGMLRRCASTGRGGGMSCVRVRASDSVIRVRVRRGSMSSVRVRRGARVGMVGVRTGGIMRGMRRGCLCRVGRGVLSRMLAAATACYGQKRCEHCECSPFHVTAPLHRL